MGRVLRVTIAALLLVATMPGARAQDDDDQNAVDDTPHVTIVGSASTEVAPDLATITLGVTKRAPTAKAAADATSASAAAVVAAAKASGVADADVQTQALSLEQTWEDQHDPQGRFTGRRPNGFEASNTIAIRIRDLARAGTLAQSLIDNGANTLDGIAFSVEHPQPILDRLAAQAVVNARRQAELVAQAAGVRLGRVLLIERPAAPEPARPIRAVSRMAAAAAVPVEAGSQGLAADMAVTWALDQP